MPKKIDLVQGSAEWKAWRHGGITASMTSAIINRNPFKTKLQQWEEIMLGIEKPITPAMERGKRLESVTLEKINRKYNLIGVNFQPACFEHDTIPWLRCSLDGYCEKTNKAIEIKNPGYEAHQSALNGIVPTYNMPQLQKIMLVMDLQEIIYASDDGSEDDPVEIVVQRDDDLIKNVILPQEAEFYSSLLKFKPPEPTDRDVVKIVDPGANLRAIEYEEILVQIEALEKKAESLRQDLIRDAHHDRCLIGNLKVYKQIRKGAVDYEKIPELHSVELDKYRKEPIQTWTIRRVKNEHAD